MKRSILKSVAVNALNWIFQINNIQESERSKLIPKLFENPQAEKTYLLKPHIYSLDELESEVCSVISNRDSILAIINCFSVQEDLIIPADLKDALLSRKNIALFIGAGVSKLMGIPLWDELGERAIHYLTEKNHLNYSEAFKLKNDKYQPKQIMSIFHSIIKNRDEIKQFYEDNLKKSAIKKRNPYELLCQIEIALQKPIVKISTNIDREWEIILKEKAVKQSLIKENDGQTQSYQIDYVKQQLSDYVRGQEIQGNILYQIHGSVDDIDNAVITTSQYVEKYRDDSGLKGFLEQVFKEYTVIFIGSGIQEFEIIEHCLKHSPSEHYSLIGTQIEDKNLFRIKETYFSELKIKAIPYFLDFQWHDRLLFVLDAWANEIHSSKTKLFYDNVKLIDEVL